MESPSKQEIAAARELAGLTQTEAANLIHCSLTGWQKWEWGERTMHPAFWELFLIKSTGKQVNKTPALDRQLVNHQQDKNP